MTHRFEVDEGGDCAHCPLPADNAVHTDVVLPYAGTSGHSGTDTSRARAERRDSDGSTATTQERMLDYVIAAGYDGATIREVRLAFPDDHHGTLSGALSVLHKDDRLAMLADQRDGCHIYAHPSVVYERPTVPHGNRRSRLTADDKAVLVQAERLADSFDTGKVAGTLRGLVEIVTRLNGGAAA